MARIPAIRLLEATVSHQSQAFSYMFAWDPPSHCVAAHCLELPLIFDTTRESKLGRLYGDIDGKHERITRVMQSCWVSFIRTGNPRAGGMSEWPRYDVDHRATMILHTALRILDDPWREQRLAWEGVV